MFCTFKLLCIRLTVGQCGLRDCGLPVHRDPWGSPWSTLIHFRIKKKKGEFNTILYSCTWNNHPPPPGLWPFQTNFQSTDSTKWNPNRRTQENSTSVPFEAAICSVRGYEINSSLQVEKAFSFFKLLLASEQVFWISNKKVKKIFSFHFSY